MKKILPFILFPMLLVLGGCKAVTPPEPEDPAERIWTASEYTMHFGDTDPNEGFNRSMFAVTEWTVRYFVRPFGWLWGSIFPREFVRRLDMASDNLAFPSRSVSCMLQKRWKDSGIEFSRFLINTTLGIGGFFDPALYWFDMFQRNEDFGQAFAVMGYGPGYTTMLPLQTSSNMRDHIGAVLDYIFDIKTYIPYYASTVTGLNRAVRRYRQMEELFDSCADPYEMFKMYNVLSRQLAVADWETKMRLFLLEIKDKKKKAEQEAKAAGKPLPEPPPPAPEPVPTVPPGMTGRFIHLPGYRPENPWSDSVRVLAMQSQTDMRSWWVHLSPWNTDFSNLAENRSIPAIRPGMDAMEYRFWRSPDPKKYHHAPLVVLLPGIGAHHKNRTATGLAEVLNRHGYAVLLLPSVYCWSFYQSRHPGGMPGYTPDDAAALRQTIFDILTDLRENVSEGRRFTADGLNLVGYSMGGLHALHIAELERAHTMLHVRRTVAINPPADLVYALKEVDRCSKGTKGIAPKDMRDLVSEAVGYVTMMSEVSRPWLKPPEIEADYKEWKLYPLPQTDETSYQSNVQQRQAELLTAITFGLTLREIMMIAARDRRVPGMEKLDYKWNKRTAFYAKIDQMGFVGYMQNWVIPEYKRNYRRDVQVPEMARLTGLRGIETALKTDRTVSMLHNVNDFLTSSRDKRWLDQILGDRISWFDQGGHLGNMYYGLWQQELLRRLK